MDAREGKLAVADAAQRDKDEAAKLDRDVWNDSIFLYVGVVVATLGPKAVAAKAAPDAVASALRFLAGGYDLSLAIAFLTAATLLLQAKLARVLPPSRTHRLSTPMAWGLGMVTSGFVTSFVISCLTFGDEVVGGYAEWAAGAGAVVANFVMSARTVRRHLA